MQPQIIAIAALGKETRNICHDDKLLWHIPADLQRVKQLTLGKPLIMGRKTFASIGRALPGRTNIVLTRDRSFDAPEGVIVSHSKEEALEAAKEAAGGDKEIIIFGGEEIYTLFLSVTDKLYLTLVDSRKDGDRQFPDFYKDFVETSRENGGTHQEGDETVKYEWVTFERKN